MEIKTIELIENNYEYSEWKSLLKAFQKFTDIRNDKRIFSDIYKDGIEVFRKFPNSKLCALFILNNDNYEFEMKAISSVESENYVIEQFDLLIEQGKIGIAIDSMTSINVSLESNHNLTNKVFIVPLKVHNGIIGISLIFHDHSDSDFDQFLYNFIGLFANLLGSTIENYKILKELEFSKATLEQKIATRTLDLAQSRRELKAIFDSVLTGVIIFDLSINRIVRVNPMACKIIGLQDFEIVGRNVFDFLEYCDYSRIKDTNVYDNYSESNLILSDETVIPILRNTTKLLLNSRTLVNESFVDISKIKEAERALNHTNELLEMKVNERTEDLHIIVHKLKDEIREREEAEAKIRKMYEEQKELSELKNRFVSMVSHEFRTPLTLIKSSAQIISKFNDKLSNEEKKHYLERIVFSVDNLTDLIENVMFIGKNDAKKISVIKSKIDLEKLINEIVKFYLDNDNFNINFDININENAKIIFSDIRLLRIILNNLISNAVKYSPINCNVNIIADKLVNEIFIKVIDNGIGISDEEQDKVFDLFYRGKNVKSISGTGLGLTVVTDSLSKLDGRIEIESKLNLGSKFTIFIPEKD